MLAKYLNLADTIALHNEVMERLGYQPQPLRDEGALESAIMRPRMAAHYEDASLTRQAALLAVGISQAQAFVDGNKRTAYFALVTFLYVNGYAFTGDPLELARYLEFVAERTADREQAVIDLEEWLAANLAERRIELHSSS